MRRKIKQIRKNLGLTQADIAQSVGISRAYYCQIENGYRSPNFEVMQDIIDVLGWTIKLVDKTE